MTATLQRVTIVIADGIKMAKKAIKFKSKATYKKWLAYGHSSGDFARVPGSQKVTIAGKKHKVKHKRKKK